MSLSERDEKAINQTLQSWCQGDIYLGDSIKFFHLVDLSRPLSDNSIHIAKSMAGAGDMVPAGPTPVQYDVCGIVVLSQTCDIVRGCSDRPFIEIAPLVEVKQQWLDEIRLLKRPAYAYVPAVADRRLVADLDRTMTVEKSLFSNLIRINGCGTDDEKRAFSLALARKRSRFAFPDDFVAAAGRFQDHLSKKHNASTDEGAHLRELQQIRVRAVPSWNDNTVQLHWWFIKNDDPEHVEANWPNFIDKWLDRFEKTDRFHFDLIIACRLEDITARDYVESDRLDLDRLSVSK